MFESLKPCSHMRMETMGKVNESPGAGETGARGKVGVTGTRPKRTATHRLESCSTRLRECRAREVSKTRNNEQRRKREEAEAERGN